MRYLVLIVFLAASPALGQISLEQALEGFEEFEGDAQIGEIEDVFLPFDEDTETGPAVIEEDLESPAWITISGKLSERLVYNFAHDAPGPGELDHRGISSLRTRLDISTDIEIGQDWRAHASGYSWLDLAPRLRGRDRYPSAYLATYEEETELGEFFLQGSLADNLDLTLGRQVVIWGRSDMFRLTDVLNPLDNRLPGLTDITDLRVPRAMLRLNAYAGDWDISTIVVPDRSLDRGPVIGSDFFSGGSLFTITRRKEFCLGYSRVGGGCHRVFSRVGYLILFGGYVRSPAACRRDFKGPGLEARSFQDDRCGRQHRLGQLAL